MKFEEQVTKIKQMISDAQTIAVVGHYNPDGDCIGCCAAVAEALESQGKDVSIFVDGEISDKFSYIRKLKEFNLHADKEHFDLLIVRLLRIIFQTLFHHQHLQACLLDQLIELQINKNYLHYLNHLL